MICGELTHDDRSISGAVYQVPESEIRVKDFEIPTHWARTEKRADGDGPVEHVISWAK